MKRPKQTPCRRAALQSKPGATLVRKRARECPGSTCLLWTSRESVGRTLVGRSLLPGAEARSGLKSTVLGLHQKYVTPADTLKPCPPPHHALCADGIVALRPGVKAARALDSTFRALCLACDRRLPATGQHEQTARGQQPTAPAHHIFGLRLNLCVASILWSSRPRTTRTGRAP